MIVSLLIFIIVIEVFIVVWLFIKYIRLNNKKQYATTCNNCGLEFDFGDYDIKLYTDTEGKQHEITKCPKCKNYISVDP